jgi:hypothetical protein
MIWKIWKISKMNIEMIWENMEENSKKIGRIWKIWKKSKLNSEMLCKL